MMVGGVYGYSGGKNIVFEQISRDWPSWKKREVSTPKISEVVMQNLLVPEGYAGQIKKHVI